VNREPLGLCFYFDANHIAIWLYDSSIGTSLVSNSIFDSSLSKPFETFVMEHLKKATVWLIFKINPSISPEKANDENQYKGTL
jgi:hypothetical protein